MTLCHRCQHFHPRGVDCVSFLRGVIAELQFKLEAARRPVRFRDRDDSPRLLAVERRLEEYRRILGAFEERRLVSGNG